MSQYPNSPLGLSPHLWDVLACPCEKHAAVEADEPATPSKKEQRAEARADAVALVMHTSGTTRRPKVVPLAHSQLCAGAARVVATLQLQRTDVSLNVMPLFHLHGLMIGIFVTAAAGAAVRCAPSFDAARFLAWARGATWYSAVPTIHQEVPHRPVCIEVSNSAEPHIRDTHR